MYYTEYNLRQLLEIALRVPEVGAVNFNILYTILKAIIQKQGLEGVKPYFSIDVPLPAHIAGLKSKLNAAYIKRSYSDESLQPADSYRSDDISNVDKEDRDPEEMLNIYKKEEAVRWQILKLVKRMGTIEDEITELHVLISQMVDELADMKRITTLQDSSFTTQINELREKLTAEESTKKNVEDIIPEIEDQFVSSLSPVVQEFHKKLAENYSEGNVLKEKVEQVSLDLDTIHENVKNLDDKIGTEVELKIKENVQELVSKEIDLGLKSVISDVEALRVKHAQLDETFKKYVSDSAFMKFTVLTIFMSMEYLPPGFEKDSFDTLTLKHEELIEQIQDIEKVDTQGPETDTLLRRLEELEECVYSGSKYQTEMEGLAGMLSRFEFKSESEEILPRIFDKDESEEQTGTIPGKVKADASKKHAAAELSEISEMKPAVKTAMEMFFKKKKKPEEDERESKGMKKTVKVKEKKDADKQALKDKEKKDSDEQALKVKERKYDDKQAGKIKEKKETDKQAGKIKEKKETDKQAEKIKLKKEADKEAMEIKGKKDTDKQVVEFKEEKIADKQKEAVELKQDEEIDEYDEIKVHDLKKEDEITKAEEKSKEISKRKFQKALKKVGTVKRMHRLGEKEEGKEELEGDQKEELEGTEEEEFEDVEEEEDEDVGEIKDYEGSEEESETVEVKDDEYISTSQEDLDDDEHLYGLEKAKVKFKTAVHGVNLIGSLDKKKRKGKIEEDEEQETEQYEEKSTQELFDEIKFENSGGRSYP
ncbi:myosin-13-like [Stegodyphus dumicola]|uniref:myosin-13-like n=1 Tax=Stegodyphus dumicola TaxID=202533 RepID=UPI0015B20BE8|nr:myosin-13-like [Stegodyphus dumicola]